MGKYCTHSYITIEFEGGICDEKVLGAVLGKCVMRCCN